MTNNGSRIDENAQQAIHIPLASPDSKLVRLNQLVGPC